MLIFLIIVMGPGCGFMLYALRHFWLEARRYRQVDPRSLKVTVVAATDRLAGNSAGTWYEHAPRPAAESPEGRERAQRKVVTTYLENCLAAIPSGTGRVAMKHIAKGSS